MRNIVRWIDNKSELVQAAKEIKLKIQTIVDDGLFLEKTVKQVQTSEDFINFSKSLMSIQRKINETIHSIQDFSISSSRTIGLEIGPVRICLPWRKWGPSHNKLLLQLLLDDLENVICKCISFQNILFNLDNIHSPEEINLIDLSNQSEWSSEIMKEVMSVIKVTVEDNQDSIHILRYVIEWDYEKRFTVGECDSETSPIKLTNIILDCYSSSRRQGIRYPFLQKTNAPKMLNQNLKRPAVALILLISLALVSVMYSFF